MTAHIPKEGHLAAHPVTRMFHNSQKWSRGSSDDVLCITWVAEVEGIEEEKPCILLLFVCLFVLISGIFFSDGAKPLWDFVVKERLKMLEVELHSLVKMVNKKNVSHSVKAETMGHMKSTDGALTDPST